MKFDPSCFHPLIYAVISLAGLLLIWLFYES